MKVRFILNPRSCGKKGVEKLLDTVREVLHAEDGIFEIKAAGGGCSLGELARQAVEKGYEAVYACGGDGTINEVASELVGTQTALGVIPMGSGNGFAGALGLPFDRREAVEALKGFRTREIDVGVICGRYFFSTAGCAFDAHLSKRYNEGALSKRLRGMAPYVPLALLEFLRYRCRELTIKTDSGFWRYTPFLLTAANTALYGRGATIAPGASPEDGLLDLCIIPKIGVLRAAALAGRLFAGNIDKFKGFARMKVQKVEVKGAEGLLVHADGEHFVCAGELSIHIASEKLKVVVKRS